MAFPPFPADRLTADNTAGTQSQARRSRQLAASPPAQGRPLTDSALADPGAACASGL